MTKGKSNGKGKKAIPGSRAGGRVHSAGPHRAASVPAGAGRQDADGGSNSQGGQAAAGLDRQAAPGELLEGLGTAESIASPGPKGKRRKGKTAPHPELDGGQSDGGESGDGSSEDGEGPQNAVAKVKGQAADAGDENLPLAARAALAMIQGFKDAMDRADERHAKMGRPTKRTPERVAHILDRLSKGFFLTDICREARLTDPEFPVPRSVDEWTVGDPELTSAIAHAREAGAQTHIEQCLKIADHGFGDYVHTPFGVQFNAAAVARSKLQIETRIRYAEKIAPKRFGPKVELASNPDNPISGDRAKPLSEYPEDALMIAFEAARTRRLTDERTIEGDATDVTPKKARAK